MKARAGLFLPLRVDSGRDGRTGWEPFGGWGRLGKPLTCARSLAIEGDDWDEEGREKWNAATRRERPARPNQKGKKDYLPLPVLGMEVGGDGGGLFWLMMEREKRERGRNSGLKFFSALGEVQMGGRAHTASQPASRRKGDKRFWVVISFFGQGKRELGASR